jgi:hypothetical protein
MFFTRVYRPFDSIRILGFFVMAAGLWLLYQNGWT